MGKSGKMSESGKSMSSSGSGRTASSAGRAGPEDDSVYDFLYHDPRRIGSFLAQFNDAGHLQQIVEGDSVAKAKGARYRLEVNGSVADGVGPGAGLAFERQPGEGGALTSQRTYDPLWTNARAFLDYASEAGLIERDATAAAIGQLVLVTGNVWVVDTALIKSITAGKNFQKQVMRQSKPSRGAPDDPFVGMELFSSFPSTVQMRVTDGTSHYWGTVTPDGLTSSPGDLMLKHGLRIAGQWTTVGILDAVPDAAVSEFEAHAQTVIDMVMLGELVGGMSSVASAMRPLVGRPPAAYGITPILVFREVAARP